MENGDKVEKTDGTEKTGGDKKPDGARETASVFSTESVISTSTFFSAGGYMTDQIPDGDVPPVSAEKQNPAPSSPENDGERVTSSPPAENGHETSETAESVLPAGAKKPKKKASAFELVILLIILVTVAVSAIFLVILKGITDKNEERQQELDEYLEQLEALVDSQTGNNVKKIVVNVVSVFVSDEKYKDLSADQIADAVIETIREQDETINLSKSQVSALVRDTVGELERKELSKSQIAAISDRALAGIDKSDYSESKMRSAENQALYYFRYNQNKSEVKADQLKGAVEYAMKSGTSATNAEIESAVEYALAYYSVRSITEDAATVIVQEIVDRANNK